MPQDLRNKGLGFLGALKRPDGGVSTELSMGTSDVTGEETEIPLILPSSSPRELDYLLNADPGERPRHPLFHVLAQKAIRFAKERQSQGLPFFAESVEANERKYPWLQRASVQEPSGDIHLPNESVVDPRLGGAIERLLLQRKTQ